MHDKLVNSDHVHLNIAIKRITRLALEREEGMHPMLFSKFDAIVGV